MSEMVERVAKAISNPEIWDEALLKFYGDLWMYAEQDKCRARAVRAIAAMRQPTEAMASAGALRFHETMFYGEPRQIFLGEGSLTVWQRMIDEALK